MHHQTLFAGTAALGDQTLGVIGILDVLVTTIAARVTGDELVVEVDADPVGIGFDRQSAVSEDVSTPQPIGSTVMRNQLMATLVEVIAMS